MWYNFQPIYHAKESIKRVSKKTGYSWKKTFMRFSNISTIIFTG